MITFHLVVFGWILFRAQSLDQAGSFISRLFAPGSATLWSRAGHRRDRGRDRPAAAAGARASRASRSGSSARKPVVIAVGLAILILFVGATVPSQGVAPFIYFRF